MKKTCFTLAAIGLMAFGLASFGQTAHETQPFRVVAQPLTTGRSLKVRLSVTNVSGQDQVFWVANSRCTNERWKTDDPNIRIHDYAVGNKFICMTACQHEMTLRPGKTFERVVTPFMNRYTHLGRRTIRFVNLQPNVALTDGSTLSPNRRYEPRSYWSNPVIINIRKAWLVM